MECEHHSWGVSELFNGTKDSDLNFHLFNPVSVSTSSSNRSKIFHPLGSLLCLIVFCLFLLVLNLGSESVLENALPKEEKRNGFPASFSFFVPISILRERNTGTHGAFE